MRVRAERVIAAHDLQDEPPGVPCPTPCDRSLRMQSGSSFPRRTPARSVNQRKAAIVIWRRVCLLCAPPVRLAAHQRSLVAPRGADRAPRSHRSRRSPRVPGRAPRRSLSLLWFDAVSGSTEAPHSDDHPPPSAASSHCPGLSRSVAWDDPQWLRGDLCTAERLEEHAVEIARAQSNPSLDISPGPLRERFHAARERISHAYRILERGAPAKRELSPQRSGCSTTPTSSRSSSARSKRTSPRATSPSCLASPPG